MATCPHCLGPLTDTHRCPKKRHDRAVHRTLSAIGGGAAAFVLMALLDPAQRSTHLDLYVIVAGALVGAGVHYLLTRRSTDE